MRIEEMPMHAYRYYWVVQRRKLRMNLPPVLRRRKSKYGYCISIIKGKSGQNMLGWLQREQTIWREGGTGLAA